MSSPEIDEMTQKLRLTRKRYEENHLEEDLPLVLSYQLQLAYLAEPSLIRDPVWGEFIKEIKSREFTPGASRFNEILAIEEVHTLSSALYENSKSFRGVMKGF